MEIQDISNAIDKMRYRVDAVATKVMREYITSLNARFFNHYFVYQCGMGMRSIEVYNQSGVNIASVCQLGVEWHIDGLARDNTPLNDVQEFMSEFVCALRESLWFDSEETAKPDFLKMKLDRAS